MNQLSLVKLSGALLFGGYFWMCVLDPKTFHAIDTVNLIFHEAGHTIFFFLPQLLVALAGSVFQVVVPLVLVLYFYRRRDTFSGTLLLFWVAQNIAAVSVYVSDAIAMQLPLLGGDSSIHDWNFILSTLGMLKQTYLIANGLMIGAYLCMVGATVLLVEYFFISYVGEQDNPTEAPLS